ncbi:MAG: hypothetical protein LBC85_05300 [Fibromonadaceae bacterium]|jgi:hypothetical protein|nr:hypothetical protein [Fibromonadaceae bacterium]
MKTSVQILTFAIAISIMLLACSDTNADNTEPNGSFEKMPIMDKRVVSHKKQIQIFIERNDKGLITDKDTLKLIFPHILNYEQIDNNCSYFAIYLKTSSTSFNYNILSQDMILYNITPGKSECPKTSDISYELMLVCDDTAEWNLKSKINLDSIRSYVDSDWDCSKEDEYKRGRVEPNSFSYLVFEKPVMDSRVVSYKRNEWLPGVSISEPVTDTNDLKILFPHIFNEEQTNNCNYFAIFFSHHSSAIPIYRVLSQDMVLYQVYPENRIQCPGATTSQSFFDAMLVCDDTAEGNLMKKINFNIGYRYADPSWDCTKEKEIDRGAFF